MPEAASAGSRAATGRWLEAAEDFYDREALEKALPGRQRLFAASYRAVRDRLGLAAGSVLLDAGCGCGEMAGALDGTGIRAVGVDVSRGSLRKARGFHPSAGFLGGDLGRLPFRAGSFDAVAAITSVEFCRDKAAVFREFHRVLKDGGRLYIDVRNDDFLPFALLRPLLPLLQRAGILEPYPAEGFRDLDWKAWVEEASRPGFRLVSLHPSLWPWNFGGFATRAKNLLIEAVKRTCGIRRHYMVGLLLEKTALP